jgi:hypothetical protein
MMPKTADDPLRVAIFGEHIKHIAVDESTFIDIDRRYQAIMIRNGRMYAPRGDFRWDFVADDGLFKREFTDYTRAKPKKPFYDSVRVVDNPDGAVAATFIVWDTEYRFTGYCRTQSKQVREVLFWPE